MTRPVAFGLNVDPNTGGLAIGARIAAIADAAGLEHAGVQNHPYTTRSRAWAVRGALSPKPVMR